MTDGAAGDGRRRFLKKAGIAAGAAWVAPVVLSVPTPAGAQSLPFCMPGVLAVPSRGCSPPHASIDVSTVSNPGSSCVFYYEIVAFYMWEGQGFPQYLVPCTGPVSSFSHQLDMNPMGGSSAYVEVRFWDACTIPQTHLGTYTTPMIPLCA